jgi:hypothetical protein
MSLSVQAADITRIRDLITLYIKKGAFEADELIDVGTVHKSVSQVLKELGEETSGELTKKDVTYILNAMTVCAQRTPVELQNYKPIYTLFETLSELLKATDA